MTTATEAIFRTIDALSDARGEPRRDEGLSLIPLRGQWRASVGNYPAQWGATREAAVEALLGVVNEAVMAEYDSIARLRAELYVRREALGGALLPKRWA